MSSQTLKWARNGYKVGYEQPKITLLWTCNTPTPHSQSSNEASILSSAFLELHFNTTSTILQGSLWGNMIFFLLSYYRSSA